MSNTARGDLSDKELSALIDEANDEIRRSTVTGSEAWIFYKGQYYHPNKSKADRLALERALKEQ